MPYRDKAQKAAYIKLYMQRWRLSHKAELAEYNKRWQREHRAEVAEYGKRYRQNHNAECIERNKQWNLKHRDEVAKTRGKLKQEVLTYYGNDTCACLLCGFGDIRALSIDHINGMGSQHRKTGGVGGGYQFYFWLKSQGFPEGYQTLCMNCQFIKREIYKEYAR